MEEAKHYLDRLRKQLDQIERDAQDYFDLPLFPKKDIPLRSTPRERR